MQINRTFADSASAGIWKFRPMQTSQQTSQKHQRRTHLASSSSRDPVIAQLPGIHNQHMSFPAGSAPRHFQHFQHMVHIRNMRTVMQQKYSRSQYHGRQNRQGRIFGSLYQQFPVHSLGTFDIQFIPVQIHSLHARLAGLPLYTSICVLSSQCSFFTSLDTLRARPISASRKTTDVPP